MALNCYKRVFEGNTDGKVKYGGGWITTKYYLQQAQINGHAADQQIIPFQEILTTDLDAFAFQLFANTYVYP